MMKKRVAMEKGEKSMRFRTSVIVISLVSSIAIIFGALSAYLSYTSARDCLKLSITETAKVSAQTVQKQLENFTNLTEEIAADSMISGKDSTDREKLDFLAEKAKAYGAVSASFITSQGINLSDGTSAVSYDSFKTAVTGKNYIASPLTDKASGKFVLPVSVPVWKDGVDGSEVIGVVTILFMQQDMNSIAENIKVSKSGAAYIINKNGDTIAHSTPDKAVSAENVINEAKTTSALSTLATVQTEALKGGSGFDSYTYSGVKKFVGYAAVEGTDGWVIFVSAPESEFTQGVTNSIYISCILAVLAILMGIFMSDKLVKGIAIPVTAIMHRLSSFAEGDINSPVPEFKSNSAELNSLKKSLVLATENTGALIKDIDYLLSEISSGNLDLFSRTTEKYVGDFKHILTAFRKLKRNLSESFGDILQVSEQVSVGSSQVSSGAQTLAQGATEQASSIQELSASIAEVSQRVRGNAEDAGRAKELSGRTEEIMQGSVKDMNLARQAMDEISATSKDISKVIKAIDDIAFQTNILALNAAVEAARAGSAGKGFAVVADEVRNLSQKSAEAAKNTTALIENSIEAVEKGTELVSKTSISFSEVASKSAEVGKIVETIAIQAQEQAAAVSQILVGIEQVSSVVQMNSATSEESAAASEELSSQAAILKSQVDRFKLATAYSED